MAAAERPEHDRLPGEFGSRRSPGRALPATRSGEALPVALAPQVATQTFETRFVDPLANHIGKLALTPGRRLEGRLPMPECPVAVGDALQRHGRDIASKRHGGVEDTVDRDEGILGEADQLLADLRAVLQAKITYTADLIRPVGALNIRFSDRR